MTVELTSPKDGLIKTIASRLSAEGKDYSRTWVVFPEKRPAYYLRKALAEKEKSSFIPPRIDSIDSFIDKVYTERLGLKERLIDGMDAVALLFEIHGSAPERLGQDHFLAADAFFTLGAKLFSDLEELKAAATRREDLLKADLWTDEVVSPETVRKLQSLSFFYERFYASIKELGLSTRSSRASEVAEQIRPELFADIDQFIFAGFFSLERTEEALLKAMMPWENFSLLLLKGKGIESLLDKLGNADAALREEMNKTEPSPPLEFFKSADTHGQVFALNKVLNNRLRDRKLLNEKQVIVLPASETLFPLYQQTLSVLAEEDFNISMGYPLARTPVSSFFNKLFELIQSHDEGGRVYAPNYLRFVLHPYTKNIYFPGPEKRSDLTRILFHAIEEELTRRRMRTFWSLEELENDPGIGKAVQDRVRNMEGAPEIAVFIDHLRSIHANTLALLEKIGDVGDFAEKLIRILNYIYETSTARLHYFFHPYAEAFMAQLNALAQSLLRTTVFNEKTSYFNLFRKVTAASSIPFYGTPLRGLQVLGFWETRCIPFEDVYILDLNEEIIPSFKRADSLLPFAARRALGLPTYKDNESRIEYYLDTLIKGARNVYLFFVENADKERSRFIEQLIWERQKQDKEARSDRYIRTIQYSVKLKVENPEAVCKTPDMVEFLRDFTYSATALDAYLACPLQFYYAYVLNLREKEEVAEQIEKRDIGTFVHSILEEYFKKFEGKTVPSGDLSPEEMRALIDRRFQTEYGRDLTGTVYLMKLQVKRHLEEFIVGYQVPLIRSLEDKGSELRLLSLEQKMTVGLKIRGHVFRLSAKVDRTETRGGELYILDYKTSANEQYLNIKFKKLDPENRETWNQAVGSLQLPLYNRILSMVHGKEREQIHCKFLMLGKNRLSPRIEFSPYDEEDEGERKKQIETMERMIDGLLYEIIDSEIPFDPERAQDNVCRRCPYAYICNRQ